MSFFSYELPKERIAQRPLPRGKSNLLSAKRDRSGQWSISDLRFADLLSLLHPGDLLVLNNSRVIPARFINGKTEVLLVEQLAGAKWRALGKPKNKLKIGTKLELCEQLNAEVLGRDEKDYLLLNLQVAGGEQSANEVITHYGSMPIPPYIRRGVADDRDRSTYQTVYAQDAGSVAAPTAGLHFTEELLEEIRLKGIDVEFVTHHVGPGSFLPLRSSSWQDHQMHSEHYEISSETISKIESCKHSGSRVIAVGTTTVRALESVVEGLSGSTDLFITPGYEFRVVDALITNFHQPMSTHLLLVAALIGEDAVEAIYNHALSKDYRFLSYGDAMFLQPQ